MLVLRLGLSAQPWLLAQQPSRPPAPHLRIVPLWPRPVVGLNEMTM